MLVYYSWYDYYFYNWNYLFKESNYNETLVIVFIIALFKEQI